MKSDLKNKLAIVTGATRGIGRAIASLLIEKGANVIGTGTAVKERQSLGCDYYPIDFTDDVATKKFIQFVKNKEPDILINNAGINKIAKFSEVDLQDFEMIQRINITIPFLLCQAVIPSMQNKGWGRIVNISSIFGKISKQYRSAYSASKFALDGLTVSLAAEVGKYGILANCVAPGFIDTELTRNILGENGMKQMVELIPMGRLGSVEEVAVFVVWLASSENTYINGQNIAIDGGFTRV